MRPRHFLLPSMLVVASVLTGCGGTVVEAEPAASSGLSPSPGATPAPSPTWVPKPPVVPEGGTYAAVPDVKFLRLWSQPGPGATQAGWLRTRNDWGQTVPMLVEGGFRDRDGRGWLRVQLPVRPNGTTGWIRARDAALERMRERIVVDLSDRTLVHRRNGEIVTELSVGVGTPTYPTTPGSFSVWAFVEYPDPTGPYGTFALGLSGFSDVITDWPGGGRMAIHGTTDPGDRGAAVSHGCVRVWNPELEGLRDVPLGTPVQIVP